jgi:hypothetical protein
MFAIAFVIFVIFGGLLTTSGIYPICNKSAYTTMFVILCGITITGLPVLIQNLWEAIKN